MQILWCQFEVGPFLCRTIADCRKQRVDHAEAPCLLDGLDLLVDLGCLSECVKIVTDGPRSSHATAYSYSSFATAVNWGL